MKRGVLLESQDVNWHLVFDKNAWRFLGEKRGEGDCDYVGTVFRILGSDNELEPQREVYKEEVG